MGSFDKTIPYSKRVLQETKNEQESHCFGVFVALERDKGTFWIRSPYSGNSGQVCRFL